MVCATQNYHYFFSAASYLGPAMTKTLAWVRVSRLMPVSDRLVCTYTENILYGLFQESCQEYVLTMCFEILLK